MNGGDGRARGTLRTRVTTLLARALLLLYPPSFRHEVGEQLCLDVALEAARRLGGRGGLAWAAWLPRLLVALIVGALGAWWDARGRLAGVPGAIVHDVRYAVRQLVHAPLIALVSAASMAVGITVATGAFSILNAVAFRPLPVDDPEGVHHVFIHAGDSYVRTPSYEHFEAFDESGAFSGLAAATRGEPLSLAVSAGAPSEENLSFISPDYFAVLRLPMAMGRPAAAGESAIVLSHTFWRTRMGSDPNALGLALRANGVVLTVVGIAPQGFVGTSFDRPLAGWASLDLRETVTGREDAPDVQIVGRLAEGAPAAATTARLDALARALAPVEPEVWQPRGGRVWQFAVLTHRTSLAPPGERDELIAGVAVGGTLAVLLILLVCTNVASLLLARALARSHEIALRTALGATRARLVGQMLTESLLLALIGTAVGLLVLSRGLALVRKVPDFGFLDLRMDLRVASVAGALALVSALLCGLAPALHALRTDLRSGMRGAGDGGGRARLRSALIGAQVAVSCLLLLVATSTARGVVEGLRVEPAFAVDGLLGLRVGRSWASDDSAAYQATLAELRRVVTSTPGVTAAGVAGRIPFGQAFSGYRVRVGTSVSTGWIEPNPVDGAYFTAVGLPVLEGRVFGDEADTGPPVAVVNRHFRESFPEVGVGAVIEVSDGTFEIVGVVENAPYWSDPDDLAPLVYMPLAHDPLGTSGGVVAPGSMAVRVAAGAEGAVAAELRRRLRERFPDIAPPTVLPLREILAAESSDARVASRVVLGMGAVELILATAGLYGLLLFALGSRTRELGVRMALGATATDASWSVVRRGLTPGMIGGGVGLVLGVPAVKIASLVMPWVRTTDPVPFLAAAAAIALACTVASARPALRAARVQPSVALRQE